MFDVHTTQKTNWFLLPATLEKLGPRSDSDFSDSGPIFPVLNFPPGPASVLDHVGVIGVLNLVSDDHPQVHGHSFQVSNELALLHGWIGSYLEDCVVEFHVQKTLREVNRGGDEVIA